MRKNIFGMGGLAVFIWTLFAIQGTAEALAEVQFNISVGPPPIVAAAPPELVMIPGTGVYFVPQPGVDIFFYNGWWWSPRGDRWYRSKAYNGPWGGIGRRSVPGPVAGVPRDYRHRYERERRIPFGQWKKEHGEHGRDHDRGHGAEHEREHSHDRDRY